MVGTSLMVEVVRSSILQCFCRACHASAIEKPRPSPPTQGIANTQPNKMVRLATEVRATEQSKGGMKYELVLADPADVAPPCLASSPPKTSMSVEDIENKLKAAEERRQSLEAQKLNQLNEKRSKELEALQKKEEYNAVFKQAARNSLEQKMEANKENREAIIKSIQEKSRERLSRGEEIRKSLDAQTQEILTNIQKKIESATEAREAQISALRERLREHERHAEEVRLNKAQNITGVTSG
ncbi:stathmin-like isoform X5 [Limulus polyphemus]|uniref:Stathmin-like isoform X5 n=1 Tax=Limulus polyphemus TaxID=6850 RepID=A0ABM1SSA9_LIMPO|nr:stathmin-like isoform X5 [Limulus polyphemus]